MSFFSPHFYQILSLRHWEKGPSRLRAQHVSVTTCAWAPWTRFRPQHTRHLSLSPPCHFNFLQTSFSCKPWRTDIPLLSLFLSCVSLSLLSLTSASFPLVSRLHICHHIGFIALKLKQHNEKAYYTKILLELSWEHLRVLNFPPKLFKFTLGIHMGSNDVVHNSFALVLKVLHWSLILSHLFNNNNVGWHLNYNKLVAVRWTSFEFVFRP